MGNICCGQKKKLKTIVLLLVGLDNAGKTVAARNLSGDSLDDGISPTVGFSIVKLKYAKYNVNVFDLGGGSNIRDIWNQYFVDAHGVIFVVDSSDFDRLDEVKLILTDMLLHEKIAGKPVLLLANKQDSDNALDEIDLVEKLQLEATVNLAECPTLVESCSATETVEKKTKIDRGIRTGYNWIVNYIITNYDRLNERVLSDVEEQLVREQKERIKIVEKLRAESQKVSKKTEPDDIIELYSEYNQKQGNDTKINETTTHKKLIEIQQNSSSSSEDDSLRVYHQELVSLERPKSATTLVKKQLELESLRRNNSLKLITTARNNKTQPVNIYGVRQPLPITTTQSAKERRKNSAREMRSLKSAGDSKLSHNVATLPFYTVDEDHGGGDFGRQLFALNNFSNGTIKHSGKKVVDLGKRKSEVGIFENGNNGVNGGISVVDID